MTEAEQKHRRAITSVIDELQATETNQHGDPPTAQIAAIKWALTEIERLTQENADLKSKLERESTEELTRKIAELTILCVNSKCEIVRLKRRVNKLLHARLNNSVVLAEDDMKKEVIE
jgi:hypothetical protein